MTAWFSKVAVTTTAVVAMIDPLLSPSSSHRPEAPRPQRRKRAAPARTSKIFTAGASATALFSMVAAMGWQSGTASGKSSDVVIPVAETPTTINVVVPVAPTTTSVVSPVSVPPPVATVPVVAVPVVTPVPVVVPKAVAVVKLPKQKAAKQKSNTTTKSSR